MRSHKVSRAPCRHVRVSFTVTIAPPCADPTVSRLHARGVAAVSTREASLAPFACGVRAACSVRRRGDERWLRVPHAPHVPHVPALPTHGETSRVRETVAQGPATPQGHGATITTLALRCRLCGERDGRGRSRRRGPGNTDSR